jgi:hypothetical protein
MLLLLLSISSAADPIESICLANDFVLEDRARGTSRNYIRLDAKHKTERLALTLKSSRLMQDSGSSFFGWIDSPGFTIELHGGKDRLFKGLDGSPAGVIRAIPEHLSIVQRKMVSAGDVVQTCAVVYGSLPTVNIVGTGAETMFLWSPVDQSGRSVDLGSSTKAEYNNSMMALSRWHNSQTTTTFGFADNIQRVAGREMVTKVDKDQNVYVDMNELSRHRGWNFTISLEPARADVRIGNDHIKIYPGADRIHINDELVTLPGTVPTQGYGVYLPLRLLQERGYLPAEG